MGVNMAVKTQMAKWLSIYTSYWFYSLYYSVMLRMHFITCTVCTMYHGIILLSKNLPQVHCCKQYTHCMHRCTSTWYTVTFHIISCSFLVYKFMFFVYFYLIFCISLSFSTLLIGLILCWHQYHEEFLVNLLLTSIFPAEVWPPPPMIGNIEWTPSPQTNLSPYLV